MNDQVRSSRQRLEQGRTVVAEGGDGGPGLAKIVGQGVHETVFVVDHHQASAGESVGDRPDDRIYALAEDHDGRIWIGSREGLTLFDRDRFVHTFTTDNSELPSNNVWELLVDRENRLGTRGDVRVDLLRVDVEGLRRDIDEDRFGPGHHDGRC